MVHVSFVIIENVNNQLCSKFFFLVDFEACKVLFARNLLLGKFVKKKRVFAPTFFSLEQKNENDFDKKKQTFQNHAPTCDNLTYLK